MENEEFVEAECFSLNPLKSHVFVQQSCKHVIGPDVFKKTVQETQSAQSNIRNYSLRVRLTGNNSSLTASVSYIISINLGLLVPEKWKGIR